MIYRWFVIASLLAVCACAKTEPPEFDLIKTTIKDIMDAMVDPSADFLFESVVTIADEHGVTERAPQTDEEWKEVRNRAITLVEAPNLLVMRGRKVARPGEKAENPQVELSPEQIQPLIDGDRDRFADYARALQDAAMIAVKASDGKDKQGLFQALTEIDKACENCHLEYWYPNDKKAAQK
jgi:hypothetical protein